MTIAATVSAPLVWLRRRDPNLLVVRRAVRLTIVACLGFYLCRYLLHNGSMATYALFGTVALGALSQIPGTPAQRSRTLLITLPFGAALVSVGTLLAFQAWAAALGMFVLGFLVSFAGVGGPRLIGLANGAQLLYILPCFPPFAPGTLGLRIAGLTLGVVLLALAELVLWPDPRPVTYPDKVADAADELAKAMIAAADALAGDSSGYDRLAALLPDAGQAAESIRPSRLPAIQRPASAGRRDRALGQAGAQVRESLARLVDLYFVEGQEEHPVGAPYAAHLLRHAATTTRAAAAGLRGGPAPETEPMMDALDEFRAARRNIDPAGIDPERLRLGSLALLIADAVKTLAMAVRVAQGAPVHPDHTPTTARPGPFWYAYRPWYELWWNRFRVHLTPRSVYFQGALRLALALAVARLLAGELRLSHGFWVLLATLTLLRTSAADTRTALRPAILGTAAGAVLAGGLLVLAGNSGAYAIALPIVMVAAFAAGPILGQGWGQALFTLVIAMIFAQVAPAGWGLAGARLVDVLVGGAIGLLIGLFTWPRGGAGELRRATANYFEACAEVIPDTVGVLSLGRQPGAALPRARRLGELAEASYALYQTERADPRAARVDWQAAMVAGNHAVRGGEQLLHQCVAGCFVAQGAPLAAAAARVADGYRSFAEGLRKDQPMAVAPPPPGPEDWPANLGPELYQLADLRIWLAGLSDDLARITASPMTRPYVKAS